MEPYYLITAIVFFSLLIAVFYFRWKYLKEKEQKIEIESELETSQIINTHLQDDIHTLIYGDLAERFEVEAKWQLEFEAEKHILNGCKTSAQLNGFDYLGI